MSPILALGASLKVAFILSKQECIVVRKGLPNLRDSLLLIGSRLFDQAFGLYFLSLFDKTKGLRVVLAFPIYLGQPD